MQEHNAIACWPPAAATHELTKPVTTSALYGFGFEQLITVSATKTKDILDAVNPLLLVR